MRELVARTTILSNDKTVIAELYRIFDDLTKVSLSQIAIEPEPKSIPEPSTILGTVATGVMGLTLTSSHRAQARDS
ncbi:MAG: PEP-CTERM sorting domain-containing protein [Symploca sp. SIO2E9]|nr:PEP-CTERM sorting domain-containing protein [Symploca sp. SIO2E9]